VAVRTRALAGVGAALVAFTILPSAAGADRTSVTGGLGSIELTAAPGTNNRAAVNYGRAGVDQDGFATWANFVSDRAGVVTRESDCEQKDPTTSVCHDETSYRGSPGIGESFHVELRDGNDSFFGNGGLGVFEVFGGAGSDRLYGHTRVRVHPESEPSSRDCPGDDLIGGPGNDRLKTGCGDDLLAGGTGNDRINARDPSGGGVGGSDGNDYVRCGGGLDVARVDRNDLVAQSCEIELVKRRG
jgi:Ca2+-binding RTX toxin-like protein